MNYISTKDASELWNMDISQVGKLARAGKIPGAKQIGGRWMIPENTPRPSDGRTREGKKKKNSSVKEFFRFPNYINFPVDSYDPPLTEEELQLREAQLLFNECRFNESADALGRLPDKAENRFVRIGALYFACLLAIVFSDKDNGLYYLREFNLAFAENFEHKNDVIFLLYQLDSYLGKSKLMLSSYNLEPGYRYHPTTTPYLISLCIHSECVSFTHEPSSDLSLFELNCSMLEQYGYLAEAQLVHLYLAFLWFARENKTQSLNHIHRVLEIAEQNRFYWIPAMTYLFCADAYEILFPGFPKEFTDRLTFLGKDLYQRYIRFSKIESLKTVFGKLLKKDLQLIFSAMQNYPNKKIASLMNVSETTVSNRFSEIYSRLGVKNKKELKAYFTESIDTSVLKRKKE